MSVFDTPSPNIKAVLINALCLLNKMDKFELLLYDLDVDVAFVTETWSSGEREGSDLGLENFHCFHCSRFDRRAGGCAIYVRKTINACPVALPVNLNVDCEACFCIIPGPANDAALLCCLYRPPQPGPTVDDSIVNLLTSEWFGSYYSHVCLAGDFNLPLINWNDGSWPSANDAFMDAFFDCDLYQHVREPTRKGNCLDLVFTHRQDEVSSVEILPPLTPSCDHNIVAFELTWNVLYSPAPIRMMYPVYTASDEQWSKLASFVALSRLGDQISFASSINEAWCCTKQCIFDGLDRFMPKRQVASKDKRKPIWATFEAWRSIRRTRNAHRRFKRRNTRAAWEYYEGCQEECHRLCQMSIRRFELKMAANIKTDVKSLFAYTNRRQKPSVGCPVLKRQDGSLCADPVECSESFSEFFASVFTAPGVAHAFEVQHEMIPPINEPACFTREAVLRNLRRIDMKKACGPDEIPNLVLLRLADVLADPFCKLYTRSYEEGVLPDEWLQANVVPLHKKGPTDDVSNFRPISLTSKPCKTMEQILVEHMTGHVVRYDLIHPSQFGFTKGKSCMSQLLRYVDYVSNALNGGDLVDTIYFDFKKAFDSVAHDRLSKKIDQFGFHPKTVAWLKAFLSNRSQRVVFRAAKSTPQPVVSGVPQGSVMGPFLFLLYVNDMDSLVSSQLLKFADDLKLFRRIPRQMPNIEANILQSDINALETWSVENALRFNAAKCSVLHFGRSNLEFPYQLSSEVLNACSQIKDLGVVITSDLKWSEHCLSVATKANQMLGMVRRNIKHFTRASLIMLIKSLIRPHLEYAVQVWRPYYQKDIELLEKVQRRATKLLPSIRHLPYHERLEYLQLQSLETRRLRADLILLYQIVHGGVCGLDDLFDAGNQGTRGHFFKLKAKVAPKLMCRQNFFSNRVVNAWNGLPAEVVAAPSVGVFKMRLHSCGAIPRT
jgi:hypothetical protein